METLSASKSIIIEQYESGSKKVKSALESIFTVKPFIKDIKELIKTFEDALSYNGETINSFNERTKGFAPHKVAQEKLEAIVLALNEGVVLKYDGVTRLYYPWFRVNAGSGSGFSYDGYVCVAGRSAVGSRLCFKTSDLAIYAGKQFTAIYEAYLNG